MSVGPATAPLVSRTTGTRRALDWCLTHRWPLLVWGATFGWAIAVFSTARSDYLNFNLARFDIGNMVQAVWSTAHGRPLEMTMATGEQTSRLAAHVDPILVLLAPLWLVVPSPLVLTAVQIGAVALGALPVFWMARRHLRSELVAALVALTYLAYPWVAWNALDHFHPVTLAIPLFLFAVWFLDDDRLVPFALCAVLVALTGELMGVTIAALGIWYALARRRRAGLLIAALGAGWTLFAVYVVIPHFNGGPSVYSHGYYASIGGSPLGAVRTLFTDPGTILAALATTDDLRYLVEVSLPLLGLFVLGPGLALVALPQLLANALSDSSVMTSPGHHYSGATIPFLIVSVVIGLRRVSGSLRVVLAASVFSVSLGFSVVFGAWPGAPDDMRLWNADLPSSRVDALRAAVALVPEDVPVTATNKVASQLSARRYIYTIPRLGRAEWVVLDVADTWIPQEVAGRDDPAALSGFLRRVEKSGAWHKLFERNGVFVFRQVSSS